MIEKVPKCLSACFQVVSYGVVSKNNLGLSRRGHQTIQTVKRQTRSWGVAPVTPLTLLAWPQKT